MFRTRFTQLAPQVAARRTFSTQTTPPNNNSNALALAAAGALGIGGYLYFSSAKDNGNRAKRSSGNEDNSDKVEKDSNERDKHWETKDKIDRDRFASEKEVKGQAESKINEFRKNSSDNLSRGEDEAKKELVSLKEKAGKQVENAKEWAQDSVQEIQDGLHKAQEKVSGAISKDK